MNGLVDTERMTGLQIVTRTQRWKRVPNGEFWRQCLVRTPDGALAYYLIRPDLADAA
jgi:hypothetical protein